MIKPQLLVALLLPSATSSLLARSKYRLHLQETPFLPALMI